MATIVDPLIFSSTASVPAGQAPVVALVFGATAVDDDTFVPPLTGVYRGDSAVLACGFKTADRMDVLLEAEWRDAAAALMHFAEGANPAQAVNTDFSAPWVMDFLRTDASSRLEWRDAGAAQAGLALVWREQLDSIQAGAIPWGGAAIAAGAAMVVPWRSLVASNVDQVAPWRTAAHVARVVQTPWKGLDAKTVMLQSVPWQSARALHVFGGGAFVVGGASIEAPLQPVQVSPLVFCEAYTQGVDGGGFVPPVPIVFGVSRCNGHDTAGAQFFILPSRFYMSVNNITAQLLPQVGSGAGTAIHIFSLQVQADMGSFGWSFSATAPHDLFDALTPSNGLPQRVRFEINGIAFVFVVDKVRKTAVFGQRGVSFSGNSITAMLAAPYARSQSWLNTASQTAQQLAETALQYSGITLDFGTTLGVQDWLVPAGAFSHQGTRMSAVQAIAQSIGGYVQSHRVDPVLQVRHPYPLLAGGVLGGPWNWYQAGITPDVTLAQDVFTSVGTDRDDGPDINGVYVSGTNQGVIALIKRIGSAGDKLAEMVADPLITANLAAQQRGIAILGAAGTKHRVELELPVLTGINQPGILDVGQLVQVNDDVPWRGRVRGVSVNAAMPKLRQTVSIERHLEVV